MGKNRKEVVGVIGTNGVRVFGKNGGAMKERRVMRNFEESF